MAQRVKNLPAIWETWVQFLGWEDPLEKVMATHSGIFSWRIPWTDVPGRLQSTGLQRVGHYWATKHSTCKQPKSPLAPGRTGRWARVRWAEETEAPGLEGSVALPSALSCPVGHGWSLITGESRSPFAWMLRLQGLLLPPYPWSRRHTTVLGRCAVGVTYLPVAHKCQGCDFC